MAKPKIAACPRCGAKPRNASARYCARCGMDLPEMQQLPTSVGSAGRGAPPLPRIAPPPPPAQYPQQFPPQAYPPNVLPRPVQPKKKSGSGCGCLLAILVILGIFAAIGRYSSSSKSPSAPDQDVTTETLFASSLPPRPMAAFYQPAPPLGLFTHPVMRDCLVESSRSGSNDEYSIRATVGPGSRGRVMLAVYLLDSFGYSVTSGDNDYRGPDGTLSAGCWVSGTETSSQHRNITAPTTNIRLSIPMSSARSNVASAQFSLFDEEGVELARQVMPLHNLTPPGYHDPK